MKEFGAPPTTLTDHQITNETVITMGGASVLVPGLFLNHYKIRCHILLITFG